MITKNLRGAVLAGGRGRRMGGAKALAQIGGRPMLARPVLALQSVCAEVVVVAKPDTALPALGIEVLREPAEPVHPLVGIVRALGWAAGDDLLVAAGDLPCLSAQVLGRLVEAAGAAGTSGAAGSAGAVAVLAVGAESGVQPLLGIYRSAALEVLAPLAAEGRAPMREVARRLNAHLVQVPEAALVNVNTPEDLTAIRT